MRQRLEAIPLLQAAVKAYLKYTSDRIDRFHLVTEGLRLGPQQFAGIHRLLPPICAAFGISEPELFLSGDEFNASTQGTTVATIALGGELLDSLTDDELRAVMAHECGHILANHVLYNSMAAALTSGALAAAFKMAGPLASVASGPLQAALMAWSRASELTADRAAIAYVGSPMPLVGGLLKAAGVPSSRIASVDLNLLIAQAAEFDPLSQSIWDRLLQSGVMRSASHPLLAFRVREAFAWAATPECHAAQGAIRAAAAQPTVPGQREVSTGGAA
jgi:Zn-dependent protease with chaperone function